MRIADIKQFLKSNVRGRGYANYRVGQRLDRPVFFEHCIATPRIALRHET
jgi:hypothetical protein